MVVRADDLDDAPQILFRASEFPKGWAYYSAEPNMKISDNWHVVASETEGDDVLICTGHPFGYLKTESPFEDFELTLEWSYPQDPNCNSGILIGTTGDDKIWPTAIQVQLHRPSAGSIFPIGDAKVDKVVQVRGGDLPLQHWHKCVVRCAGGRVAVAVNNNEIGKVTGCTPQKGCIALQSEGSEIHFRRIKIKRIR